MDTQTKIGVVTPIFNNVRFADLMVHNMKNQDYPHDKIVWYLLDDSDKNQDMKELVKTMKKQIGDIVVKYRKVENKITIGKKRNLLVKCVEENIICHMDPDCMYKSNYLSESLNKLNENQNNVVISSKGFHIFVHDDLDDWLISNVENTEAFESAMMYTKKYYKASGGFDNKIPQNEGYKLMNPKKISKVEKETMYYLFIHTSMATNENEWRKFPSKFVSNTVQLDSEKFTTTEKELIGKSVLNDQDWIAGFGEADRISDGEIEDIPRPDLKHDIVTPKKQETIDDTDPQNPRVAILTPTRNRKQFWKLMLQNIKQQQYPQEKLTWYVIDDTDKNSDKGLHSVIDTMKEQLAPINVVFKSKKRIQPLGKKRNMLVNMTKGEKFILHMDDDDFYQPNWIRSYIDGLLAHPDKGVIGSLVLPTLFLHERKDKGKIQLVERTKDPSLVYTGCIGFRKAYYDSVGGFAEEDKRETVDFADHGQTMVISPHAPVMRLTPHPQSKYIWDVSDAPIMSDNNKTVSANIPEPLMEMFGKCAFNDDNFIFTNPDDDLPLVGLAMPTYCRRRFFPNIINNLKRQTYPMHKVTLYIHDDSPPGKGFHDKIDELRQKIHPVKLVFISGMEQIKPLGKKRNVLANYIQEPYIANMDDDDFYHPTWLRRVITTLLDNPDKGLVGCVEMPHIYIHSEYEKWKLILNNPNAHKMTENKKKLEFIGEASMAYTKDYFHSQGGYGEQMIQEGVKFIDPERTIDISCIDILISVNLHPEQVGHVSWNTSNKNMLFDKQQVGFNMTKQQALEIARCAFDDQTFEFGDSNPFNLPQIAVVTPTRNNVAFEDVMIENMKRQTYPHELINWYILDDSSDKSLQVNESRLKQKLKNINIIYKKLPKPVNPIGLKRNLLVKGVKEELVVHMDDAHHYMKSYVNIMVTELNGEEKRKVVGSSVTPYVYVHEDVSKWKLVGMAFGNADDCFNISPTMMAYYKSYFDERDGFGGHELPVRQQEHWMGQEVRKMIDPPKAFVIKALDKLMLYLTSHPESKHQNKRDGWDTQFAYKWFSNNGSELDKLQISDNDKQIISRAVFGDSGFYFNKENLARLKISSRKVIVSFTTTPSRIHKCEKMLKSILNQNFKPSKIILNIPKIFDRTGDKYTIPDFITNENLVFVNVVDIDYGPGTKLFPAVDYLTKNAYDKKTRIISCDDDIEYPLNMIENLIDTDDSCVWATEGFNFENLKLERHRVHNKSVDIIEGYAGVCYTLNMFDVDFTDYMNISIKNKFCKLSDDLLFSNYLSKHNIDKRLYFKSNYNINIFWKNEHILEYGKQEGALHRGIDGLDNIQRYIKGVDFLKKENIFYLWSDTFINKPVNKQKAVVIFSFTRPDYLKRVIASLKKQDNINKYKIYLYQDNVYNKISHYTYGNESVINECVSIFKKEFPTGVVHKARENLGIALNHYHAYKDVFTKYNHEYCVFFDDDVDLQNKNGLQSLFKLCEMTNGDDSVMGADVYPTPFVYKTSDDKILGLKLDTAKYHVSYQAFCCYRNKFIKIYNTYSKVIHNLFENQDYQRRNYGLIKQFFISENCDHTFYSQDWVRDCIFRKFGMNKKVIVNKLIAKNIGKGGVHTDDKIYQMLGFGNAECYTKDIEIYDILNIDSLLISNKIIEKTFCLTFTDDMNKNFLENRFKKFLCTNSIKNVHLSQ